MERHGRGLLPGLVRRLPGGRRHVATVAVLLVFAAGCGVAATTSVVSPSPVASVPTTKTPAMTAGSPATTATATPVPSAAPPTPSPAPESASPTTPATAAPTPAPTVRPTDSPAPATPSAYVTNGSRSSGAVALTFDFGGRIGDAQAIVDWLIEHEIRATIFITGKQIDTTTEGAAILKQICPLSSQFALGNHSYSHADFDTLTPDKMRVELSSTEAAFANYCNRSPRPFFRPPDGAVGSWGSDKFRQVMATVGAAGYSQTILWDVDTLDWGAPNTSYYRTAQQIIDKVNGSAQGGSIVLMHLGGFNTLTALPTVVANLEAKGYRLVTLHELLGV